MVGSTKKHRQGACYKNADGSNKRRQANGLRKMPGSLLIEEKQNKKGKKAGRDEALSQ